MDDAEYHVASFVVRTHSENGAGLAEVISGMQGLEVHAVDDGKLVVTAEADNVRALAELVSQLEKIESALSVAPVYHEFSSAGEAAQPVSRDSSGT